MEDEPPPGERFSAAICRGLIEAGMPWRAATARSTFSAAICRGLIEAPKPRTTDAYDERVFRGYMPRPH